MLQAKVRKLSSSKESGRMSPAFLAKIALSYPAVSARGFAQTWSDLVGTKVLGCSRFTIERVRDAFAAIAKDCVHSDASSQIASACRRFVDSVAGRTGDASSVAERTRFFSCAFLHIQDEASLRLRSFAASDLATKVFEGQMRFYIGASSVVECTRFPCLLVCQFD